MDEKCARALLDQLASEEPPPSRVDVRLARRRGRRRLLWRRRAAPGLSAVAVFAVAGLIATNVITLGPDGGRGAAAVVRPVTRLDPFVPYASFGWLPPGFSLGAGPTMLTWPDETTTQSVQVSAGSPATHRTITLTVNSANSCRFGKASTVGPQHMVKRFRTSQAFPNWITCSFGNGSGGHSVGPRVGTVNGHPAYGGNGLVWQYAKGSWAEIGLGSMLTKSMTKQERQERARGWMFDTSPAATVLALKVASQVRFGDRGPESFAFRLTGTGGWSQFTTDYTQYAGQPLNTALWLGPGITTNDNPVKVSVTPASKPAACAFSPGQSRHVTLDGAQFTVTTMKTPLRSAIAGNHEQTLCGYADHLQVNLAVGVDGLGGVLSGLTGTQPQNAAVRVFQHLTLLGPDPRRWSVSPVDLATPPVGQVSSDVYYQGNAQTG